MTNGRYKPMSLSKESADVFIVFLTLVSLGIHAVEVSEQIYVRLNGYGFSGGLQKRYTNIVSPAYCAYVCLSFSYLSFTYNKVTKECRIYSRKFSSVGAAPVPASSYYEVAETAKTRCEEFSKTTGNGVYQVHPSTSPPRQYYCYTAVDNRLWNVIQYRYDGSVDFDRTWDEYKNGFGSLTQEFWLGNNEIHRLTAEKDTMLRIEMEDYKNNQKYAQYNTFYIDDEQGKYKVTIGGYTGTSGDSFSPGQNGMYFSTKDRDNDNHPTNSCAQMFFAGYWFNFCMNNNLNGKYGSSGSVMHWFNYDGTSAYTPLKVSRMMIRKK